MRGRRICTLLCPTSLRGSDGQSLIEFAVALPLVLMLTLGVVEVGYFLLDQHIVTKMTREGSNLISRNTTLKDASVALGTMSSRPVNFSSGSKVIFSVIRNVETTGTSNYGKPILYQRYEYGTLGASSKITTRGSGSFGTGPEYTAINANSDTNLQITNMPPCLGMTIGSLLYVTELYSTHPIITPYDRIGVTV